MMRDYWAMVTTTSTPGVKRWPANYLTAWAIDPHHETADTLAVEDAADELAHKLGDA